MSDCKHQCEVVHDQPDVKATAPVKDVPTVQQKPSDQGSRPIVVVKIGSSSLSTSDGKFLNMSLICALAENIVKLRKSGFDVILVTSGAVSIGCSRMRLTSRPTSLATKQAIAAVGQSRLMHVYDDFFAHLDQPIAQVLLSRENLSKRRHYLNALNTFKELLSLGVVPIVNENDTTTVSALSVAHETVDTDDELHGHPATGPREELRFGDNDTLSALVASVVEAEWLVLLTDVDALYTADPRRNPDAKPIRVVENIDSLNVSIGDAGSWGTGGMGTKIQAARIATACGVRTTITLSTHPEQLLEIVKGAEIGTQFLPRARPLRGKKTWIAHGLVPSGSVTLDDTAITNVLNRKSLFATGIVKIEGEFPAHASVTLKNTLGKDVARGLINYSSTELALIQGHAVEEWEEILHYRGPTEVIHRENLVPLTEDALIALARRPSINKSQGSQMAPDLALKGMSHSSSMPAMALPRPGQAVTTESS